MSKMTPLIDLPILTDRYWDANPRFPNCYREANGVITGASRDFETGEI